MRLAVLFVLVALTVTPTTAWRAQSLPAFEVVSIKPAKFPNRSYFKQVAGVCEGPSVPASGRRQVFPATTVCKLIRIAYDLNDHQIVSVREGIAGRQTSAWYEVDARAAAGITPTVEETRLMLQTMLAERFNLKFHRESRQAPVYALTVTKDGHKLGKVDATCEGQRLPVMLQPGILKSCAPGMSMAQLVVSLTLQMDRPVVDHTGLPGTHAFSLQWAANEPLTGVDGRPSLFTAVQEQLGLKLEPATDAVDVFVVDSVESPSPN